jgi:hypothetical protein
MCCCGQCVCVELCILFCHSFSTPFRTDCHTPIVALTIHSSSLFSLSFSSCPCMYGRFGWHGWLAGGRTGGRTEIIKDACYINAQRSAALHCFSVTVTNGYCCCLLDGRTVILPRQSVRSLIPAPSRPPSAAAAAGWLSGRLDLSEGSPQSPERWRRASKHAV